MLQFCVTSKQIHFDFAPLHPPSRFRRNPICGHCSPKLGLYINVKKTQGKIQYTILQCLPYTRAIYPFLIAQAYPLVVSQIPTTDLKGKLSSPLKELYTSISTLAQTLVLTILNNEFILKILNSTPFGQKIRKHFRPKNARSTLKAII